MGIILDSSVAIAAERRKLPVEDLLAEIRAVAGPMEIALSVASVMELEHGIWRAPDATRANQQRQFLEDLIGTVPVYPITVELARRAGRVDAESAKRVPGHQLAGFWSAPLASIKFAGNWLAIRWA
jgi:predicted nucleic acid-binding protein